MIVNRYVIVLIFIERAINRFCRLYAESFGFIKRRVSFMAGKLIINVNSVDASTISTESPIGFSFDIFDCGAS